MDATGASMGARRDAVQGEQTDGAEADSGCTTSEQRRLVPGRAGGDAVEERSMEGNDYSVVQNGAGARDAEQHIDMGVDGQSEAGQRTYSSYSQDETRVWALALLTDTHAVLVLDI